MRASRRIREVVASVVDSFATVPPVHGAAEAGRLESGVLDRMGTFIVDQLGVNARKHNLGRWELIQAYAQGRFP